MQLNKDDLLTSRKYFARIFLDYLMNLPDYQRHAQREALATELITLGKTEKSATSASLNAGTLYAMNQGKQRLTHWLSYALMIKAIEKGFTPSHPADSLGIAISMHDSYQLTHTEPLTQETLTRYFDYLSEHLSISIPPDHHDVICEHFLRKRLIT